MPKNLEPRHSIEEANCLLVLCNRLIMMLGKQIANQLETFKREGGFTEGLTAERLAYRTERACKRMHLPAPNAANRC